MHALRRLYVYGISGVSLAVMLVGLDLLLAVALGALGLGRGEFVGGSSNADREQLSLAAALTVVGVLVWGVHWWFAERSVRTGGPAAAEEQGSALRALYLSGVMGALLAFGSVAALALLRGMVAGILDASGPSIDAAGTVATVVVTGAAWTYHARVRMRDLEVSASGAAAWIPRVYLYGATLVSLVLLAAALGRLLEAALAAIVGSEQAMLLNGGLPFIAAEAVASILAWTIVWLGHWWYASALLHHPGWRGISEQDASLRVTYYTLAIAAGSIGFLWLAADGLRVALAALMGVADVAVLDPGPLVLRIGAPLLSAAVWLGVALLHRAWMRAEASQHPQPGRAATIERLEAGTIALVGLAFTAIGIAWIVGIVFDIMLGGSRTIGNVWRVDLSRYAALAVLGLGPWIWNLARLQRRAAVDPMAEAASPVRRAGLLLAIGAAILAGIGGLALVLYRTFGALFGAGLAGSVSELSQPLAILLVALAIAAYHANLLRRDQQLRAVGEPEATPAVPLPAMEISWPVLLTVPEGADLEDTLSKLRAHLPPGGRLERGAGDGDSGA